MLRHLIVLWVSVSKCDHTLLLQPVNFMHTLFLCGYSMPSTDGCGPEKLAAIVVPPPGSNLHFMDRSDGSDSVRFGL